MEPTSTTPTDNLDTGSPPPESRPAQQPSQQYLDASTATATVYEPDDEWAGYDDPTKPPAEPLSVILEDANLRVVAVGSKPQLVALFTAALEGLSTNASDYLPPPEGQPPFPAPQTSTPTQEPRQV